MAKTPTWQRKAGQNPKGGLNEAGRRSLKAAGHDIKRPQPEGGSRRDSFCARMKGMKAKLTSAETANDPNSRINKSLRAWNCHADGGAVRPELGGGGDALKAAMKIAQNAIRAYHGSSHKFDKFDINKIGTGVGGNLRGNGLYFSAEEPIAREYRDGLSQTVIGVDGRPLPEGVDPIVKAAARSGNSVESFMDSLRQQRDKLVEKGFAIDPKNPDLELDRMLHELQVEELGKKINALEPYAGKKFGNVSTGHMYEVDINTSPEKLLDWDKPYHQQSEHVRNVLDELKVPVMMRDPFGERKEIPTPGFLAYSHLGKRPDAERFGATRASDTLKEAGIPGITYSDDLTNVMSKPAAASNNPQNYVMFDPSLIDILRRYGQGGEVRPEMGAGGSGVKAAVKLAQDIIKAYHASGSKFDKFDNSKIGSGVGAQAYGKGHYLASSDPVARGYLGPEAQYDRMSGKMNPKEEFAFDIATNASDPTSWTIIKPLVEKYGSNISYDEAEKLAEEALAKRGHMYEVGIHANPEHFLDWDKRFAEQSPYIQERLTPQNLRLLPGGPEGPFNGRRAWVDETGLPLGRMTTAPEPPRSVFTHGDTAPYIYRHIGREDPTSSSEKLQAAGIAGIKYLDPSFRHLGEGARNYVVFNPDILDIMRRYGQGGEVRPEMGGGGNALSAAVKMAQDIIKAYHGSPYKFDKFDISKIGTGEGAQAYGHGLYFADKEGVARSYRDALAAKAATIGGKPVTDLAAQKYRLGIMESPTPEQDIADYISSYQDNARYMMEKRAPHLVPIYDELKSTGSLNNKGHMYEVGIRANPEHLLDWDKPIANQPNIVRGLNQYVDEMGGEQGLRRYSKQLEDKRRAEEESFARLWDSDQPTDLSDMMTYFNKNKYSSKEALADLLSNINKGGEAKGEDFYRSLAPQEYDYKGATETASRLGIPGIKYLDRMSRGAGEGSSNYVVFDPKIIDIMRRYADGGRIHFDEGGLARIEELLRQAKGEEQATQASHPVGMSGNVEFAPVEIDEPLTGSKIPLGSLPAPTAAVVNPVANILAQYGPYAMGPIPAGMAAARDLATGIKEGSGLDVATAAMGAPGKMAKYGLPALGAVTDLLSPTEAQAGAGSKLVKGLSGIALRRPELFRAEHPYFPEGFRDKMAGIVSPFSKDEDIAKAAVEMAQKYRTPLENKSNLVGSYYGTVQSTDPLSVMRNITDIPGISLQPKTAQQSYEDLYKIGKGGTLINLAGDRSDFGRLTHIGGRELEFPVDLHAGPKYMLEPNPGEIWANAPEHAGKLQKKVAAAEKKGPVIGMYTPMGAQSVSSSQHMFDALMAQMKGSGASKEDMRAFDEMLRKGEHFGNNKNKKKAVEYMKGWPGLENAREAAEFAKGLPGHHRAAIVNEMEKARWKKLGFPEVGVTRVAVTDPDVLSTAQNLIGGRATTLSTKNPRGADPLFQHSTYGSPTYGEYLMELPFVQRQYAMPEAIKKYTEPTKTGTVVHPFSEQNLGRGSFRKLFETNFLTQPINQQWLDTIMTGLERQKQYGFNKGGKAV